MLLRLAEPENAMAVARVHVRSWQAAYRAILPDEYLDRLRPEDRAEKYDLATRDPAKPQTRIATEDGRVLGFATTMPSGDQNTPGHGELCALYVDPEHWGRGIGAALVADARARLAGLGFEHALLWVLTGNVRAESFYRRDGWVCDGTRRSDLVWGITVDEIRYQRQIAV